jgi:hypothetical protein
MAGGDMIGRDASYLAPPAQSRTGPIRAYGSHLGCLTAKRASCESASNFDPAPISRQVVAALAEKYFL